MKFRIKQKGDLEYAKFYPQKKGWKTMWMWEYFSEPFYIVYPENPGSWFTDKYTKVVYKIYSDAENYIEKYKKKHLIKISQIN